MLALDGEYQRDVGTGGGYGIERDHAVAVVLRGERMRDADRSYNVCIKIF